MVQKDIKQAGFAHIEAVIFIVVIVMVGAVGVWVTKQSSASRKKQATTQQQTANSASDGKAPAAGTISSVESDLQGEADEELKAEDEQIAQAEAAALSDAQAVSSTGEGYEVN